MPVTVGEGVEVPTMEEFKKLKARVLLLEQRPIPTPPPALPPPLTGYAQIELKPIYIRLGWRPSRVELSSTFGVANITSEGFWIHSPDGTSNGSTEWMAYR